MYRVCNLETAVCGGAGEPQCLPAGVRRLPHFEHSAAEVRWFVCLLELWKPQRGVLTAHVPLHWSQQDVLCQCVFLLRERVGTPAVDFGHTVG